MRATNTRAAVFWWALFALLCISVLVIGFEAAAHFQGPAIDGPFQLYNALRRIWVGQQAGVDFQFFHGIGIPYVHYLQFRLLGGTFMASELTRQFTSSLLYPLTVVVFLRFFIKDWTRVAAWSAIVMMMSIALQMNSVIASVNSLLGMRSTFPILLPIAICLPVRRWLRVAITGIVLGLALLMGTEQGLAALGAMIIATVLLAIMSRRRREYVADSAIAVGIGVATLAIMLVAIGGFSGMLGALRYNFRLVPMDHYWYFGAPPNAFLRGWSALFQMAIGIPRIPISILLGLAFASVCVRQIWHASGAAEERERFAFLVLALYGVLSCASLLGTYVAVYIQPLLRVLLLLCAVALDRLFPAREARVSHRPLLAVGGPVVGVSAGSLVLMLVMAPSILWAISVGIPHLVKDHVIRREPLGYSDIWPETLVSGQKILDAHRHPDGSPASLWSTYAGLLEARNGLFNPSFDYIIHALGPDNRAKYLADFRRVQPELVQTVSPLYRQYESWIATTSWDFYAHLLENYQVVGSTPWSLFWERLPAPNPAAQEVWSAAVPAGATSVTLPPTPGTEGVVLLQVQLDYKIRNPLRVLPVVGGLPRYLVKAANAAQQYPVSLDPYVGSSRFPVVAYRGKNVTLSWQTFSLLPGAGIEVSNVRLAEIPVSTANLEWLNQTYRRETSGGAAQ